MLKLLVPLFVLVNLSLSVDYEIEDLFSTIDDWDYIMFSQRWPVTGCSQWKEKSPKNTCSLPHDSKTWTVHGLWPTKTGTNGPNNCNSAIHFDPGQLQPILNSLNEYWINVEANTAPDSFWKHEWGKHGTCASSLPELNSVYNFFWYGLQLNKLYNIETFLSQNNILPNQEGYSIEYIYDTIKNATGKHPEVECVVDGRTKNSLISEIRLCFDKNMELIDCIGANSSQPMLSNCSGKKPVMYYGRVPEVADSYEEGFIQRCLERHRYNNILTEIYTCVKLLMWLTL